MSEPNRQLKTFIRISSSGTHKVNFSKTFWINFNYKYFNAFILILSALCNSMVVQSLSTINHEMTEYYNITSSLVSFCALVFFLINPFSSLIANYILDNKGLKMGVIFIISQRFRSIVFW